jgi:hypothetical protein
MRKKLLFSLLVLLTLIGGLSFASSQSVIGNYAVQDHVGEEKISQDPLLITMEKQLISVEEQNGLFIWVKNQFNHDLNFTLQINGSNFFFDQFEEQEIYELLIINISLSAGQTINKSLSIRYNTIDENYVSSIQTFSVMLFDNTSSEVIFSSTEWLWIYTDFSTMYKPHISSTQYPLYSTSKVLVTYSILMNESIPNGVIIINVNNIDDVTHNYKITLTNNTSLLKFDEIFSEGYQCTLICSDRSFYHASFEYSLPEDSVWGLLPFTLKFRMDSDPFIEKTLLLEISTQMGSKIIENNQKGTYQKREENLNEIKIFSKISEYLKIRIAIITEEEGQNALYYPEILVKDEYFTFNISSDQFSTNSILLFYGMDHHDTFQKVNLHLVEVIEGPLEEGKAKSSPGIEFLTLFLAIPIMVLISRRLKR